MKYPNIISIILLMLIACDSSKQEVEKVQQWTIFEISLESDKTYNNPYTDLEVWAEFTHESGNKLKRPAFWDGENTWKIRFAPNLDNGIWEWETYCSDSLNSSLQAQKGKIESIAYNGKNELLTHGFLSMSPKKRNVIHADGHPFLLVGDTPWAIPFRATKEQVEIFALDRKEKGFNAALLMSIQPDMEAEGPEERNAIQGFDKGFEDLSDGHINKLKPDYFQYLDSLVNIFLEHGIVPVYQPVFHGFGWKGKKVLGNYIDPDEYVRYVKYLLARYGAQPAFWLLAGDNGGRDPGVKESGEMLEIWDAYKQPTGLHYNPCDDYVAEWALDNPIKHCMHYNKTYQKEVWLDFQWAQTGHSGEHLNHKVERMYENLPIKASANGEPTYEGMNDGKNGLGWWQGEEAWMQWLSGGTMGIVYGAAGIWQWKISADEPGWTAWATQNKSWREAMEMDGSTYAGMFGKILNGYNITDIEKRKDLSGGKPLLAKEGELYISYLDELDEISIEGVPAGLPLKWVNPKTGYITSESETGEEAEFQAPDNKNPWVLIIGIPLK